MSQAIIYLDGGFIQLVIPTGEIPIEAVAKKDIPSGKPYLFVDTASLPDLRFQQAWTADFSNPDGYGEGV